MTDAAPQRSAKGSRLGKFSSLNLRAWRLLACMAIASTILALDSGIVPPMLSVAEAADPAAKTFELVVRNRKVVGRKKTLRVTQGDTVTLRWRLDRAADIHVHGYNLKAAAKPGAPAEITFKAATAGRFSVSAHWGGGKAARKGHSHKSHSHSESRLIYLEVYPR